MRGFYGITSFTQLESAAARSGLGKLLKGAALVQFRRSKKFGPFRLTLTQKGISASAGAGPIRISKGADGKVRRTLRVPGTGIYDVKVVGQGQQKPTTRQRGVPAMNNAPAGWYPDPSGAPGQRFWDGQQWTESFDPPRETVPPAPQAAPEPSATVLPVWSSLREFSSFDVPENFVVTNYMRTKMAELFADHNVDTSEDSPLLGAMAYAIFNLEVNSLVNLLELNAQLMRLKRAFFESDSRLAASGLPSVDPELRAELAEEFKVEWN